MPSPAPPRLHGSHYLPEARTQHDPTRPQSGYRQLTGTCWWWLGGPILTVVSAAPVHSIYSWRPPPPTPETRCLPLLSWRFQSLFYSGLRANNSPFVDLQSIPTSRASVAAVTAHHPPIHGLAEASERRPCLAILIPNSRRTPRQEPFLRAATIRTHHPPCSRKKQRGIMLRPRSIAHQTRALLSD